MNIAQKAAGIILLILIVLISFYSFGYFIRPEKQYSFQEQLSIYKHFKIFLLLHIGGGIVALLSGAFQIFACLRNRVKDYHRIIGSVYIGAVIIGGLCGLILAPIAYGLWLNALSFGILGFLWLFTTLMGFGYVLNGNIVQHRLWMLRSYALTLAAVSLRVEIGIYAGIFNMSFDVAYSIAAWTCWTVNILIVELYIIILCANKID